MAAINIKCPICGETRSDETYEPCPFCGWVYDGCEGEIENPDEREDMLNPVSYNQAKERVAKGLNIWGEPLPKKQADK